MNLKTTEMDMLHGPLAKKLLLFTLPIALSTFFAALRLWFRRPAGTGWPIFTGCGGDRKCRDAYSVYSAV